LQNASILNKGHFANFAQKLDAMAMSKKFFKNVRIEKIHTIPTCIMGEKIVR